MQVMTLIINDAKPVRIAIGSDSDVTITVQYIILKVPQRIFCRCRHFPAKQCIVLGIDGLHRTTGDGQNRT